jgi:hypothetical protein
MSMNRGAYLMARLTTKGLQPGAVFGGKAILDRMDIAAACTRLDSLSFHLVMAKYCDDVKSALHAVGELQDVMSARSAVWADMEPARRMAVACALIEEFVSARKCPRCKGTGQVTEDTRVVDCTPCQATGFKTISATARAAACGMAESTFRHQRLNESFQDMIRYLNEVEINALESVCRKAS